MCAAMNGHTETADLLIQSGATVDAIDKVLLYCLLLYV